jgi:hypothetical protein
LPPIFRRCPVRLAGASVPLPLRTAARGIVMPITGRPGPSPESQPTALFLSASIIDLILNQRVERVRAVARPPAILAPLFSDSSAQ